MIGEVSCLEVIGCTLKAVDKVIRILTGIKVEVPPAIVMTRTLNQVITGEKKNVIVSITQFSRTVDGKKLGGMGIVTIPVKYAEVLFKKKNINWNSTTEELKVVGGEFCNIIMEAIKNELGNLADVTISQPKTYVNKIIDLYKMPDNHVNFSFIFRHEWKDMFVLDLMFFEWDL